MDGEGPDRLREQARELHDQASERANAAAELRDAAAALRDEAAALLEPADPGQPAAAPVDDLRPPEAPAPRRRWFRRRG